MLRHERDEHEPGPNAAGATPSPSRPNPPCASSAIARKPTTYMVNETPVRTTSKTSMATRIRRIAVNPAGMPALSRLRYLAEHMFYTH